MRRGEFILGSEDIDKVWALLPTRVRPQESLDEAFFRTAVELAVLQAKLLMSGSEFRVHEHAYTLDPTIQRLADGGLAVSWTWLAAEEAA